MLPVIDKIMAAIFAWGFEECGALSRETVARKYGLVVTTQQKLGIEYY